MEHGLYLAIAARGGYTGSLPRDLGISRSIVNVMSNRLVRSLISSCTSSDILPIMRISCAVYLISKTSVLMAEIWTQEKQSKAKHGVKVYSENRLYGRR